MLNFVTEHKYLGVILDHNMSDDFDIKQQVRATYARGNVLISRFRKCTDDIKVKLFKTFCNSFYGCNIWVNYHVQAMRKLRSAYGRIFRNLLNIKDRGITKMKMVEMCVDPVEVIIRKNVGSFYKRVFDSNNVLIVSIVQSMYFL